MTAPQITPPMAMMIRASWEGRLRSEEHGFRVELLSPSAWSVARKLEQAELGTIEGSMDGRYKPGPAFRATRAAAVRLGLFE